MLTPPRPTAKTAVAAAASVPSSSTETNTFCKTPSTQMSVSPLTRRENALLIGVRFAVHQMNRLHISAEVRSYRRHHVRPASTFAVVAAAPLPL